MPLNTAARAAQQGHRWRAQGLMALALIGTGVVMCVRADDRPFLRTTHAMASEDEDGWEVSSTWVGNRQGHALSVQIERDLSSTQRVELEWGKASRVDAPEPEQGLRLRSLWVSPQEQGWGLATKLGVEPGRGETGQRQQALAVASVPFMAERLWLHANVGWQWQRRAEVASSRANVSTLAAHYVWTPQRWLYAESTRTSDGRDRLVHAGVRQWLSHNKLALDTGWGKQSGAEHRGEFLAVNLSWFDLND